MTMLAFELIGLAIATLFFGAFVSNDASTARR
jgi:hypothetical protein